MMTVHGYSFQEPVVVVQKPRTSPYLWMALAAAGLWWWWRKKQGKGFMLEAGEWRSES